MVKYLAAKGTPYVGYVIEVVFDRDDRPWIKYVFDEEQGNRYVGAMISWTLQAPAFGDRVTVLFDRVLMESCLYKYSGVKLAKP